MYTTVDELGFSDHCGTIMHMTFKQKTVWFAKKRLFNKSNMQKFKSKLNTQNWNNTIQPNKNLDENYQSFHDTLTNILNEFIPTRKIKLRTRHQ